MRPSTPLSWPRIFVRTTRTRISTSPPSTITNGNNAEAQVYYENCCEHDPDNAAFHNDLGVVQFEQGKLEEALKSYRRAVDLDPDLLPARNNMSLALRDLGRIEEAHQCLQEILAKDPHFDDAWCNLGLVLEDLGQGSQAMRWFQRVLERNPDDANAKWNRVLSWLLAGDYARGWPGYELRWDLKRTETRPFTLPRWDGSALNGRTLLVYAEQGLGDEIMMASCLPDLAGLDGKIIVECDRRLQKLFARSFPWASVHGGLRDEETDWLAPLAPVHCQVPIASLPLRLRRCEADFPRHEGYLKADQARVAHWRGRLQTLGKGLKIGLSWQGGTVRTRRILRSIALEQLRPLIELDNAQFVSLQYGAAKRDVAGFNERGEVCIHEFSEALADYDETAALVSALDMVVSIQTAIIHLAGSLGTPAWVMVPFSPEWRYRRDVDTMPWYPCVRLFRQQQPMRWEKVIGQVREGLGQLTGAGNCQMLATETKSRD